MLDASAAVELVLTTRRGRRIEERIAGPEVDLAAPSLLDVEVLQALRRLAAARRISAERATLGVTLLDALEIDRYHHAPLGPRIWRLRHRLTAYDAAYCVLAEALAAPLLTCDARLARAPGLPCGVDLVA